MQYDNSTGQMVYPQRHLAGDLAFLGALVMGGVAAYDMTRQRRNKIAAMTPPEREAFVQRTRLRVAKRIAWAVLWVVLLWVVFTFHLPGIAGTLVFAGLPVALFAAAIARSRRFWASRQRAWDGWFRSRGSSLAEVRAWWPTATDVQHQEFIAEWGLR